MSSAERPVVAFLDKDHMLEFARLLLIQPDAGERNVLRALFTPETIDVEDLLRRGDPLRERVAVVPPAAEREALERATAIVFRRGEITRELIEASPRLRLIQRLGSSTAGIDLDAARERGVHVSCVPRLSLGYTADHAFLLVLALAKRLFEGDRAARSWDGPRAEPGTITYNWAGLEGVLGMEGTTLGLVGFGEVARLVSHRARAFGMRVLYTARTRRSPEQEDALGVSYRSLDELLAESRFVSVHVPLSPATQGLIGREQLARMAPDAFLVNTARGGIVDEDALYDALANGRLAGAGLDVQATEPLPADDRLCRLENVILTPHVAAGSSRLLALAEVERMYDNIAAVLDEAPPPHARV